MCGIYGYIGKNYRQIEPIFSKYLYRRGPDDSGVYYDDRKNLILGHRRLSIIDLSDQGHQPMISDDGNFVLVFNGEVYNYQDIRTELQKLGYNFRTNSDTEVILKAYIEWREKCLEKFRGMFAFCIYNRRKNKLFLARDRFGIKPLIYGFVNNRFVFSSELKPILNSSIFPKKLNYSAVSDYFKYGSVRQPHTILENFYFLMPSHFMAINLNSLDYKIEEYFNLVEYANKYDKIDNYAEAVKLTRNYLEEATEYHMIADVEVGAFLSGGIDSTAVVALMKQYSNNQINTFSVGFKQKTDVADETDVATRSAKFLETKHHNIKIDDGYVANIFDDFIKSLDQPSIDGINTYIVSLETSKDLKVALSGLGGDEIFAGYPHFKRIIENSSKKHSVISRAGEVINIIRPNRFTNKFEFYGMDEYEAIKKQRTINNRLSNILVNNKQHVNRLLSPANLSPIQKISLYEINNYLLNTLLRDGDVLSMAHSLEVRPVLLDHKLVEFVFSLKDTFKIKNGKLKSVFIDSVKDIIPSEVWKREKTGFEMPFARWINGILNDKFKEVLENKDLNIIFQKSFLDKLKYKAKNKKLKRSDWMNLVFMDWLSIYNVEL